MARLAITGATGAMGRELRAEMTNRSDLKLGLLSSRAEEIEADVPLVVPDDLESGLREHEIDVLVDFTVPEASIQALEAAEATDCATVIGTTGFDEMQRHRLQEASERVPVLHAANFSRGIHALIVALRTSLEQLSGYDIEVTETHHNRKRDAPSGTANRIVSAIEAVRPTIEKTHGRVGDAPRSDNEIGIHARRAGTITGEHEVLLAGNAEELRFTHRAESRRVFAAGALDAAVWLANKSPGWYRFEEVLET